MNLKLENIDFSENGIFGILEDETTFFALETLQHSYQNQDGSWYPKLPKGVYTCVRGTHRLPNMIDTFDTFEVTNVLGHSGILFHCGNYNKDSEGCVLLGCGRVGGMVVQSKKAFQQFMDYLKDVDEFELTVI